MASKKATLLELRATSHYFIDDKKWFIFKTNYLKESQLQLLTTSPLLKKVDPLWENITLEKMFLAKFEIVKLKFYNEFGEKVFQVLFIGERVQEQEDQERQEDQEDASNINFNESTNFNTAMINYNSNKISIQKPSTNFMLRLRKFTMLLDLHFSVVMKPLRLTSVQINAIISNEYNYPNDCISVFTSDTSRKLTMELTFSASALKKEDGDINKVIQKFSKTCVNIIPKQITKFRIDSCEYIMINKFSLIEIRDSDKTPAWERLDGLFEVFSR